MEKYKRDHSFFLLSNPNVSTYITQIQKINLNKNYNNSYKLSILCIIQLQVQNYTTLLCSL